MDQCGVLDMPIAQFLIDAGRLQIDPAGNHSFVAQVIEAVDDAWDGSSVAQLELMRPLTPGATLPTWNPLIVRYSPNNAEASISPDRSHLTRVILIDPRKKDPPSDRKEGQFAWGRGKSKQRGESKTAVEWCRARSPAFGWERAELS
jgi:hypothetical protein